MSDKVTIEGCGVYAIRNRKNGKKYVGSTADLRQRWGEHRGALRAGRHINRHLQSAWNKYGEEAFDFIVLEYCTPSLLIEREQAYLPEERTVAALKRNGYYNQAPIAGSVLGYRHSEETRRMLSEHTKKQMATPDATMPLREGWKRYWSDPEARKAVSARERGKRLSPETRQAISQTLKNVLATTEARQRRSAAGKAYNADPEVRRRKSTQRKAYTSKPEIKAKIAEETKQRWTDPVFREAVSAKLKERWTDPAYRQRVIEKRKATWQAKREAKANE